MSAAELGVSMPPMTSAQIADDLADRIRRGEFPSGTRLPYARELAEQYGCEVSRIRRAEQRLTILGMLEYAPGEGIYVREA